MEAIEFYNKRIIECPNIENFQLMEEYAKHIIEINFCGTLYDFENLTIDEVNKIHKNINLCVDWAKLNKKNNG